MDELADLVNDRKWYVPGEDDGTPRSAPNRPLFVSFYKHDETIVVGSGFDAALQIREARESGIEKLPLVLVYNHIFQRPVGGFAPDARLRTLADEFYERGLELTAVPEWQVGDYHKLASPGELKEVVEVPEREDVSEVRWETVKRELLANDRAPSRPLLLTLVRTGAGRAWVDKPVVVSVASEMGIEEMPVVLFYHRLDRSPCGEPADGEDMLCKAALAAGAEEAVCRGGDEPTTAQLDTSPGSDALRMLDSTPVSITANLYSGLNYTQNHYNQDRCAS
ncbi:MAG: hypothetical protein MAG794_01314 [Gammaproteobacteria bacterium]|nr:hypothetical protein [Gammaproteobacteria bacterium]